MSKLVTSVAMLALSCMAATSVHAADREGARIAHDRSVGDQVAPISANETRFVGTVMIDGAPAGRVTAGRFDHVKVEALVNGRVCSSPQVIPPHQTASFFHISVDSEVIIPGCAKAGDRITFRVDGRLANETVLWQAGALLRLDLTVGSAGASPLPTTVFLPPSTGDAGLQARAG
jgi:hypothetical protein